MIEQALHDHLKKQASLVPFLAQYSGEPAIFNQEAPSDADSLWGPGAQYGRIVFSVDIQGDPERTMGGTLTVDLLCKEDLQIPEVIEPLIRAAIHGFFFSNGTFTVAAQWKSSSYFTETTDQVTGCTISFDLLGFPIMTTDTPDVISRMNEWCAQINGLHIINHDELPETAWKPTEGESAIYWRLVTESPAGWIADTFQTIWRTATIRCHIFAADYPTAANVARNLITRLYQAKRLLKEGEQPIMVNRNNTADYGADPLRTGQVSVEATYGIIVHLEPDTKIQNINY